ncbi:hypothetical protein GCM10022140_33850 [Rhodococcus aetherivorans]
MYLRSWVRTRVPYPWNRTIQTGRYGIDSPSRHFRLAHHAQFAHPFDNSYSRRRGAGEATSLGSTGPAPTPYAAPPRYAAST